jgi:uncharacterized protein (TIGR02246 family)
MRKHAILGLLLCLGASDDGAAIRATAAAFDAALNSGNAKQAAALWVEGGTLTTPGGNSVTGRAEMEKMLVGWLAGPLKGATHTANLRAIHFVTPDVAVTDGDVTLVRPNQPLAKATLTQVLVKRQGRWLLADVRAYVFMPDVNKH